MLVHGFASGKDNPSVARLAALLFAQGFDVLTYDSRGHGESSGTCTLGRSEHYDVAAAVSYLSVSRSPRVVVGVSLGSVGVLRYLAQMPGERQVAGAVDGVVLVSSPADWRVGPSARAGFLALVIRTRPGRALASRWLGVRIEPTWQVLPAPVGHLERLAVPVAVVHGERDRLLSPRHARLLFAAAPSRRELIMVPDMGHGVVDESAREAVQQAVDWMAI